MSKWNEVHLVKVIVPVGEEYPGICGGLLVPAIPEIPAQGFIGITLLITRVGAILTMPLICIS
jgi:hypothetical protein